MTSNSAEQASTVRISVFTTVGVACFIGVLILGQELLRVALELRNPNGTYTLGVGWLRLSWLGAMAAWIYWASHAWLLVAGWRMMKKRLSHGEWVIFLLVGASVGAVHFLVLTPPLNNMLTRPLVR